MGESLEWNRARCFLRGRYGGGRAIRGMRSAGDTWLAEVEQNGVILRVKFQRTGHRRWTILSEEKGEGDDHTGALPRGEGS